MYKARENYNDLIAANLADVLVEPYIRAVNLVLLSEPASHDDVKVEQRAEFIRDARKRGSQG